MNNKKNDIGIIECENIKKAADNSQVILQKIINLLPIRIFWKDKNLKYLGCNEIFAKDAGKKKTEDLLGKDDYEMAWKEQAKLYQEDDQSVMQSGKPKLNFVEPQTTPKGDKIWLKTSKLPLTDSEGNIIGVIGTYEDITEHKNAEDKLKEEQTFSKSIIDNLPGIFYLYSYPECRMVLCNKQHELLLGYEVGYMKGHHATEWHSPESHEAVMAAIKIVMEKGQNTMEATLLTKDGRSIPFYLSAIRFEMQGNEYFLGFGIDISESKKKEEELKKMNSFMIDRELAMVEMKNKIKELEKCKSDEEKATLV